MSRPKKIFQKGSFWSYKVGSLSVPEVCSLVLSSQMRGRIKALPLRHRNVYHGDNATPQYSYTWIALRGLRHHRGIYPLSLPSFVYHGDAVYTRASTQST